MVHTHLRHITVSAIFENPHLPPLESFPVFFFYDFPVISQMLLSAFLVSGNFSCLHVLLVFTRDKNFYFSTVFVPAIILVASAFISFWLDKGVVPARVMIGVTTMLSFCTTTNNFRSSLPVVSNLTAMNLWDGVCMFFIYSSLLEFVVVNYLYRKPRNGGREELQVACNKCKTVSMGAILLLLFIYTILCILTRNRYNLIK